MQEKIPQTWTWMEVMGVADSVSGQLNRDLICIRDRCSWIVHPYDSGDLPDLEETLEIGSEGSFYARNCCAGAD